MIGPITPPIPQLPDARPEPAQAPAAPRPVDEPQAGTGVETRRAARPIPEDTGQRAIETGIAAMQARIYQTESAASRDRLRLERLPAEIEGVRAQLGATRDPEARSALDARLSGLQNGMAAAQKRMSYYESAWPEQKAQMMQRIEAERAQLAETGYRQL